MHIAFVIGYPTPSRPEMGPFVKQFVWAMARQGNECSVITPVSVFDRRYGRYPPRFTIEDAGGGNMINVYRPLYISFSSRDMGWIHTGRWTQWLFNIVARRAIHTLPSQPDLIYGHFLYHQGRTAVVVGKRLGVPSVVGVGEGTFWTVNAFGVDRARMDFRSAAGFLANASHIRDGLIAEIGVPPEKIVVEPNGVDRTRFFKADQSQARVQLELAPKLFIIAFVGTFNDLKGGCELVAAVNGLDGIGVVMIGHGEKVFESEKIIYKGKVCHNQIAIWLTAADIFVLPTREEGSCNAVIEAMACGLPIVTANGRYMDDIVDNDVAIRVDPTDVRAIREAIVTLKNDPQRRKRMSDACLRKAKQFDINDRARRVTAWMKELKRKYRT